jgi:hypothetical protein
VARRILRAFNYQARQLIAMGKHSLLVVDDDPVILKLVCEFLKRFLAHVHVDTTDSPNMALYRAMSH